ncbi:transmembrane protein 132D [Eucyclogobius newberryi]|uniref:transmembrane protein 132D n=1 Tax=Eucyclogobius newberryi TaxID=166745 RepID=UPI003B5CFAFB
MRTLLLLWATLQVQSQSGPLSLPLHLSLSSSSWQYLPLVQSGLGQVFSNSSPFSSSHSLLLMPPSAWAPPPELHASFGPYSVTQSLPSLPAPSPPSLSASLLSEYVEKEEDERGQDRFRVRVLFHQRPDSSGTCVSLHAFRETEESKALCVTQPPLGFCVVTLTLPSDWFKDQDQSEQSTAELHSRAPSYRRVKNRTRQKRQFRLRHRASQTLRYESEEDDVQDLEGLRFQQPTNNHIQLYYSTVETFDFEFSSGAPACEEDQWSQSQRQLFFLKSVHLKEEKPDQRPSQTKEVRSCLHGPQEAELNLDAHVVIGYHRGPVLIGQPIRVSVSLRANFSNDFVIIKLKVPKGLVSLVAQRTLTSDLWAVTLEKTQGPDHDVVSILCHKHSTAKHKADSTSLQQVVCLSVDGLRRSFGVAMSVTAQWWVEYSGSFLPPPHGAGESVFTFTDRPIIGIAPITESKSILNTAILTSRPVSLPVIVLAVSRSGKVSDVTSAVSCHSENNNILKVSSDCSSVFVDGSESGEGDTCALVRFTLGTLSGALCLQVWAPSVPLRVSLSDPVLNAIQGWDYYTDKGCESVYQRTSVQVLTQFQALDSQGKTKHFLSSSDWFADVTELVRDWLRIEDPHIATLGKGNNIIGRQPGKTTLYVVSAQWDGTLGGCDFLVTPDPVEPDDLSVQVVSGLGMTLSSSQSHPAIVTATVTPYNIFYSYHQEASVSVCLQFSDDTAALLSSFSDVPSFLRLSSLAESVIVVSPGSRQRIFATGDGGGPLLRTELLVATCQNRPLTSNLLTEGDQENSEGLRKLARGSGWIRVNLDVDYAPTLNPEEFEFEFGDTLAEIDGNLYATDLEDENREFVRKSNPSSSNGGLVRSNNLEKANLMPNQEEGMVFFAPSQEKERWEDEIEGEFDLQVGLGAVLSLICLFTILFLANCLPCALRERVRKKDSNAEECTEIHGEIHGEPTKDENTPKNSDALGEIVKNNIEKDQEQGTIVEYAREVEIIC